MSQGTGVRFRWQCHPKTGPDWWRVKCLCLIFICAILCAFPPVPANCMAVLSSIATLIVAQHFWVNFKARYLNDSSRLLGVLQIMILDKFSTERVGEESQILTRTETPRYMVPSNLCLPIFLIWFPNILE